LLQWHLTKLRLASVHLRISLAGFGHDPHSALLIARSAEAKIMGLTCELIVGWILIHLVQNAAGVQVMVNGLQGKWV
jgi:hypothetical protein